jgi:hypothetical protein
MGMSKVDAGTARRAWRALEAVHGMIYFTPDALGEYAKVGVTKHRTGYFASRSAAMGEVTADVVIATFYNFDPSLVRHAMHDVWTVTTPAVLLAARLAAVDASLTRAFGPDLLQSSMLAEAAEVAHRAALVACERPEGRPLFAGHAALAWPDQPHLVLWHAQTLLREFRGDGHIAALTTEGLSGIEALVSHAASGDVPAAVLRTSRAWSDDAWAAAVAGMVERGLVQPDGSFTESGEAQRRRIEDTTDRLALAPYAAIGEDGCALLRTAGRTLTDAVIAAGLMAFDPRSLDIG